MEVIWRWQTYQGIFVPVWTQGSLPPWQFWCLEELSCKFWSVLHFLFLIYKCINRWQLIGNNTTVYLHLSSVLCQACALYNNWWPMLSGELEHHWNLNPISSVSCFYSFHWWDFGDKSIPLLFSLAVLTYVLLPMPLLFFAGSDDSIFSESDNR